MRLAEEKDDDDDAYAWSHRNNNGTTPPPAPAPVLLGVGHGVTGDGDGARALAGPVVKHRHSVFSASGTALVFDPRRASWQPLRPCTALSYSDLVTKPQQQRLDPVDYSSETASLDVFEGVESTIVPSAPPNTVISAISGGPRLSTNAPARIMTIDRLGPQTRNIAPKARIIKNVLVLGCSYMCSYGCFAPLRTYLSVTADLKFLAPLALVLIELSSAISCFYGSIVARKLTYKMTIALCQIPFALLLGALSYNHYYTIVPAALLLGLSRGPLWNASVAYLINMAAQFAYFSYETQDKMVKRFLSTFNTLMACGWTWGHLLTAGAFSALESARNDTTRPWYECPMSGSRYCNRPEVLDFPTFGSTINNFSLVATGGTSRVSSDLKIVPVYSSTVYAGNVICAVVLALFLLDKLKVQLCSQTNKPASAKQLFSEIIQIFFHERMRLIFPMFLFIGLQEAFIVCDVMKVSV